jgi:hypothetical protein
MNKRKTESAAKHTTRADKSKAMTTSNRVLLRATLDSNGSIRLLKAIGQKLQLKRSPTVTHLLTTIRGNKKQLVEFTTFYRDRWPRLEPVMNLG